MTEYLQIWLSAERESDAQKILSGLTSKKLIVGGSIINAPSHFWWKGKEIDLKDYCYVMAFTTVDMREAIETEYSNLSSEEIPMASFIKIDGNDKFLAYIYENTHLLTAGDGS
jgi:uncharacterized protein involved in tolerance to divalent cations